MATNEQIKKRMRAIGLTQNALARKAGLSQSGLSTIISGKANPREDSLQAIAAALKCNVSDLFDEPTVISATSPGILGLSAEETILVENFRKASLERQNIIMEILSR